MLTTLFIIQCYQIKKEPKSDRSDRFVPADPGKTVF